MPLDRVPLLKVKVKGKGIALERASPPQGNQKGKGAFPCLSRHVKLTPQFFKLS